MLSSVSRTPHAPEFLALIIVVRSVLEDGYPTVLLAQRDGWHYLLTNGSLDRAQMLRSHPVSLLDHHIPDRLFLTVTWTFDPDHLLLDGPVGTDDDRAITDMADSFRRLDEPLEVFRADLTGFY